MSDDQIRTLEAQVMKRKQTDAPFKNYFKNLAKYPNITDQKEFEEATIRSMQSNGLIKNFMFDIKSEIATKTADLKSTSKDNQEQVSKIKAEIEQLIVVYQKYLYELKKNQWNFKTIGNDIESMKIPQDVSDNLWRIQKEYGITFELPIPTDLGEDYGKAFERQGKLIPGLTLMYDDLSGKEVNWHQVMIYRENEKTPYERFKERREAKLKEFEAARQAEIQSTISNTMENNNGIGMRQ